jgi:hypothetical protein
VTTRLPEHGGPAPEAAANSSISAAEASVARAEVEFSASVKAASLLGRETAERVVSVARPVLIGVGILAGTLLAVRLLRGGVRPAPRGNAAPTRSLLSELGRAAAVSLAVMAGRRIAERWIGPSAGRALVRLTS